MLGKLREILLTEYIGSILIALLLWNALTEFVTRVSRIVSWIFNHRHQESVLGIWSTTPFAWDRLLFSAVTIALYLGTGYALAKWLYAHGVAIEIPKPPSEAPESV